jgi:hypothetical protein
MDHKDRKRFGFVAGYARMFPETPLEKWRQRQLFSASLIDPKAHIMITGTGA